MALGAFTPAWRRLQSTARAQARLLVVDDEASVRTVLQEFFVEDGITVDTAASAEAAWPIIEANKPDLVIVDKNLPAQSGLDLLQRLDSRFGDRPIEKVLITGFPSVETVEQALAFGASDYLSKPFEMEHVQSRVRALLDKSARQAVFERILADVHTIISGAERAVVDELKRRLEATRRHIDAASSVFVVGTANVDWRALETELHAPALAVRRAGLDDVYDAIAAGASPRVVVLTMDGSDVAATVRQLKAADPSLDVLLVARVVEVARLIHVINAGAADFVLPTIDGMPLLARRLRRLAERVRRHRLYLGLLSALYRFAAASDPVSADEVLAIAAPVERKLVRAGFGAAGEDEAKTGEWEAPPLPGVTGLTVAPRDNDNDNGNGDDDDSDDIPTIERIFAAGRAS